MKKAPELIDTHAHLTFPQFADDLPEVMNRAWSARVGHIVVVGAGDGIVGNEKAVRLANTDPRLFAAVGVHPHDAGEMADAWIDDIRRLAKDDKVVAVGEIGLDYCRRHSDPGVQRERFGQLLSIADEVGKPVIIHDRDAHDDVWGIVSEAGVPKKRGVFHCFSGDVKFARKVVDAGFFISIPGIVTFRNARELQEVMSEIALENMLLETDCPYLAPEPYRGRRNEPAYIGEIAECVARIKGLSADDVARVTTLNAKRLFGLPGADLEPHIAYKIRNSLYLNITNRCNLACKFCPKFSDFEVKGYYLKLEGEPDVDQVFQAVGQPGGYDEIVFCGYGEPLLRLEILKVIAVRMKERGARRIRVNTDGLANLVYGRNILPELKGLVDSISVSLNAPDAEYYSKICPSKFKGGAFHEVCKFVREAKAHIPEVVVSVVALPDLDLEACRRKAGELGVALRIREYMSVG